MDNVDIEKLLLLETELKTERENATPSVSLDAKVNILNYLKVSAVGLYQAAYDVLFYELNREGGLECLRNIAPVRSKDLVQPKVLELQSCDEDARLAKQLKFYLADAELAKKRLDKLVAEVTQDLQCEVQCVDVKSLESTQRKARKFCGGDVRKVTDMARVAVICDTPETLKQAYLGLMTLIQPQDVLRVANGFNSDWMPSGYRDVKMNPIVNEHLCEIQLHLRDFFTLKSGQHAVYTWARELNVTTHMHAENLCENLSAEVTREMVHLARQNWHGTGYCLTDLQLAAGQYDLAAKGCRQELSEAEAEVEEGEWGFEDHLSEEKRMALLRVDAVLSRLSVILERMGKYDEADPLYARILDIQAATIGEEHPNYATTLSNRAGLLVKQGKYAEAELLHARATEISEKTLGPEHPLVAGALNKRAGLLEEQGQYAEAELLYERCQAIKEKVLGPEHPSIATTLNNRALLMVKAQGKYDEAEPLYARAIAIGEKVLGPEHPDLAVWLNNRAELLRAQGNYAEAEPLYERSQAIREKVLGLDHPHVAQSLSNRALLLSAQGRYAEAEPLYERCQAIEEKVLGPEHPDMATTLNNRAELLRAQGNYAEAVPLNERATGIWIKALGPEHPTVATALNNRAGLLTNQGKYDEAHPLYIRVLQILAATVGEEHPNYASTLNNRAGLLESQGKYEEAEPLYKRSLAIDEKVYGPEHPTVATALNNRAGLLKAQGKLSEAEPLYKRTQEIFEKSLGQDHPNVATILNNRALLLYKQEKYTEAIPLVERALSIRTKKLGETHPDTVSSQNSLEIVRKKVRAQLGRLVVKRRRAQPLARGHGTTENTPFHMAGVKTRSKKRPSYPST